MMRSNNKWLQTQDTIELIDENAFKWLGRRDFIINSGGFKIHPEKIERQLKKQTDQSLIITYLPDDVLGQKVILLMEGRLHKLNFNLLHDYEKPKKILSIKKFIYFKNGKINRGATHKEIKKQFPKLFL